MSGTDFATSLAIFTEFAGKRQKTFPGQSSQEWRGTETSRTWTVGHRVKVAVGQHEVLRAALGLQPHGDVGDPVVEAGEAPQEVDGEGAGGPLHVHRQLVGPRRRLRPDAFDLLQQVAHRQDLVLVAADRPRPHAGDLLQVLPEEDPVQSDWLVCSSLTPS